MSADGPITRDGERLVAYLVQLALEGVDRMEAEPLDEYGRGDFGISAKGRRRLREHLSERMAQAAQCIVCEVAEIERADAERLAEVRAAVRHHQDVAHLWHEEVSDAATFAERMETLVAADARLSAAIADGGES